MKAVHAAELSTVGEARATMSSAALSERDAEIQELKLKLHATETVSFQTIENILLKEELHLSFRFYYRI